MKHCLILSSFGVIVEAIFAPLKSLVSNVPTLSLDTCSQHTKGINDL